MILTIAAILFICGCLVMILDIVGVLIYVLLVTAVLVLIFNLIVKTLARRN